MNRIASTFKKILVGVFIVLATTTSTLPLVVSAVAPNAQICSPDALKSAPKGEVPTICKDSDTTNNPIVGKTGIVTKVIQTIVYITGIVATIMIVIGGFRYTLSAGDSNATKGAKDTILYALVGLIVAIFAQVLVSFVLTRL